MLRVGDLVYFDADEERHYHALHMTVGRVADEDVHDAKPIYVCFSHAGFEKWIGVERLRPCIGSRGPYFVGDMAYGNMQLRAYAETLKGCAMNFRASGPRQPRPSPRRRCGLRARPRRQDHPDAAVRHPTRDEGASTPSA